VADYYIICHGINRPQVEAIADSVLRYVDKKSGEDPWHKEGVENAEWILLDYVDVVVHIFMEDKRRFYHLESLWADAEIENYSEDASANGF
jgi:ribosome-associated protein